jgi:hypothetical protein
MAVASCAAISLSRRGADNGIGACSFAASVIRRVVPPSIVASRPVRSVS